MGDRIALNDDDSVDDVVLDATSVHIEDLGDRLWIGVYRADGDRFVFEVTSGEGYGGVECFITEHGMSGDA